MKTSNFELPESADGPDIAVIGMAGRFPGARNVNEFWQNLISGREALTIFSDEDIRNSGVKLDTRDKSRHVRAGFILENIEEFDAAFFNVAPREAELIDPQFRVFLECTAEAL